MAMTYLWTGMMVVSVLFAFLTGQEAEVSQASLEGATSAIQLSISMAGILCLWSGMMEVMGQCGLAKKLAQGLSPLLKRLFPDANSDTLSSISANMSANLLGLGNAATPMGLQAAKGLSTSAKNGIATPSLCLFIVCNTASIQLIPSTVASLRAATGSQSPLEILPAVWITSFSSLTVGILMCKVFQHYWGRSPL